MGADLDFFSEHDVTSSVGVSGDGSTAMTALDLVRDLHMAKSEGPWQNGCSCSSQRIKTD